MSNILFYSLDASPIFDVSIKDPIGGAEMRAFNFAKFLVKEGNKVNFIVKRLSGISLEKEGVKAYPVNYFKSKKSFFLKVREKIFYRFFCKSDVPYEVFLKNSEFFFIKPFYVCSFGITGNAYNAYKLSNYINSRFILFIASDEELNFDLSKENTKLDTSYLLAKELTGHAHKIFVQNLNQKAKIRKVFDVNAELLLNPIDLNPKFPISQEYILWVGKSSSYKNPDLFIELASCFPHIKFLMICNKTEESLYTKIMTHLPTNCILIEHVNADNIESYFSASKLFVNTSDFEGFPNTFLQAAKYGKPIISFKVNPNEFITRFACGVVCNGDKAMLVNALHDLLTDAQSYEIKARNSLAAVKQHGLEEVGKILARSLAEKVI